MTQEWRKERNTVLRKLVKLHNSLRDKKYFYTASTFYRFGPKPKEVFDSGIKNIPEDRHKRGLVLDFTVAENTVLQNYNDPRFSKNGILNKEAIEEIIKEKYPFIIFDLMIPHGGINVNKIE